MSYQEYLRSFEWGEKRRAALERAGRRCQVCAYSGRNLDVHHNSYANIGDERPEDLVVLCRLCHRRHHHRPPDRPGAKPEKSLLDVLRRTAKTIRNRQGSA